MAITLAGWLSSCVDQMRSPVARLTAKMIAGPYVPTISMSPTTIGVSKDTVVFTLRMSLNVLRPQMVSPSMQLESMAIKVARSVCNDTEILRDLERERLTSEVVVAGMTRQPKMQRLRKILSLLFLWDAIAMEPCYWRIHEVKDDKLKMLGKRGQSFKIRY
ncbi:Uncharacterized protein Fot_27039 [Forsythia ovata]|uniref:Uncharacterized protein n=1 Tax=Forsythia ovata TaxID=205694 RepID=A0ABD1UDQ5_9LAMI